MRAAHTSSALRIDPCARYAVSYPASFSRDRIVMKPTNPE
jgi:hypothetical protein